MRRKGKSGFTLIELLVVIIILGILAAVALPRFLVGTEAAKCSEAKDFLGSIRSAEVTYQFVGGAYSTDFNELGINAVGLASASGTLLSSKYWNFTIPSANATNFTAMATRRNQNPTGGTYLGQTITIVADGTIAGSHVIGNRIGE